MLLIENASKNKQVVIWKDEIPFYYEGKQQLELYAEAKEHGWNEGVICIEAKLNPLHISNYAMICMKYTKTMSDNVTIIIYSGEADIPFKSRVLPLSRSVYMGLNKEFEEVLRKFFEKCPNEKLPSGKIEILCGGCDEVGSSEVSFNKVMDLLFFAFSNIGKIDEDDFSKKILGMI